MICTYPEAEQDSGYVQIIPCGLLTYKDQVFVFQRKEADPKYRLYGKTTIWQGCHVNKRDGFTTPELLQTALLDRISRYLFLSRKFPTNMLGYCWDREDLKSSRHFGLVYRIQIDNPDTAVDLKKKEFRMKRGFGFTGGFNSFREISDKRDKRSLESWSRAILDGMGG